jgi:hypothetical protein
MWTGFPQFRQITVRERFCLQCVRVCILTLGLGHHFGPAAPPAVSHSSAGSDSIAGACSPRTHTAWRQHHTHTGRDGQTHRELVRELKTLHYKLYCIQEAVHHNTKH